MDQRYQDGRGKRNGQPPFYHGELLYKPTLTPFMQDLMKKNEMAQKGGAPSSIFDSYRDKNPEFIPMEEQDYQDLQDAWALKVQEWENPYHLPNLDLGGQVISRAGYTVNQQPELEDDTDEIMKEETSDSSKYLDEFMSTLPVVPDKAFFTYGSYDELDRIRSYNSRWIKHFESLSEQDQDTYLRLFKMAKDGIITADQLVTLNSLLPDFISNIKMEGLPHKQTLSIDQSRSAALDGNDKESGQFGEETQRDMAPILLSDEKIKSFYLNLSEDDKTTVDYLIERWDDGTITNDQQSTLITLMPVIDQYTIRPMTIAIKPRYAIPLSEIPSAIKEYNALLRAAYFQTATPEELDRLAYLENALTPKEKRGILYELSLSTKSSWPSEYANAAFTYDPDKQKVGLEKIKVPLDMLPYGANLSRREKDKIWMLDELRAEYDRLKENIASGAVQSQDQSIIPGTQAELDHWYANQKQAVEEMYSMERLAIPTAEMLDAFLKLWDSWSPEERNKNALIINTAVSFSDFDLSWGKGFFGADKMENLYMDSLRNYYMLMYARSGGESMEPSIWDGVTQGVASAFPEMVMTGMTLGMSKLPTTQSLMAYGSDMYNVYNTIARSFQSLTQDPKFIPSFAVQFTSGYKDASTKSGKQFEATAYAWLNGFFGAAMDINGVFLADETVSKGLKGFVEELSKNGGDETLKGLASKMYAMMTYDRDKDIFSFRDSDALLYPQDMAESYVTGTAVGGIESGPKLALNAAAADLMDYVQASFDNGLISEKAANEFLEMLAKVMLED